MENRLKTKDNKSFVSIVIPWYNRKDYFERIISSINMNTDMPFELIIHDDSSSDGTTEYLISRKADISTLILNTGNQLGLANSVNRCVEIAGSKYIVFINSDCIFNRPFLKDLVNVLEKPYVGWIGLTDEGDRPETIDANGTKFSFCPGIGSGCAFAFTTDVWKDIGGFDINCRSGCADSPFQYRSWAKGYFRALITGKKMVRNLSQEEKGNEDSTIGKVNHDCGMPKLFNIKSYNDISINRWNACEDRFRNLENKRENVGNTTTDMNYWHSFSMGLMGEPGYISKINWDTYGKDYNHLQWREMIEGDYNAI